MLPPLPQLNILPPFLMDSSTLRDIAITSTDNNVAVNFTVIGTDLSGLTVTEVITGINNNTIVSAKSYIK
jgi:hypothetical protein